MSRLLATCAIAAILRASDAGTAPASAQELLAAQAAGDAQLLAALDLDRDRRISRVEALAFLYGRQALARRQARPAFAQLDSDGDGAISRGELEAWIAGGPADGLAIAERRRSLLPRQPAAGGGAGTSFGMGGSAYIYVGGQQAYIRDYDVVDGRYDPVIGVLATGTVLEVSDIVITIRRGR